MYTLIANESLRFNIDGFNENYNKHLKKATLSLFAEDELDENVPLTSLSRLARAIAVEGLSSLKIVVGGDLVLWESSDYTLDDASLSLQKRSVMVDEEIIERDVIISSLTFSTEMAEETVE